jgi:hypothetical protein
MIFILILSSADIARHWEKINPELNTNGKMLLQHVLYSTKKNEKLELSEMCPENA